jgi:hypothetical protein
VNVLRSIDERAKLMTQGSSGSIRFHNYVFDMGSVEDATAVMDAVESAPLTCPGFLNAGAPAYVRSVPVPEATGWRAEGANFGGGTGAATIGYWQREATIVKLRVLGTPDLADAGPALADKLARSVADAEPVVDEEWMMDPLAPWILEADQFPGEWLRYSVDVLDPTPGGDLGPCGVVEPGLPQGLVAAFEAVDGSNYLSQYVIVDTPETARLWVDAVRAYAGCSGSDEVATSSLPVPEGAEIDADDLAGVAFRNAEGLGSAIVAARFGGVLVLMAWATGETGEDEAIPVDRVVELIAEAVPD